MSRLIHKLLVGLLVMLVSASSRPPAQAARNSLHRQSGAGGPQAQADVHQEVAFIRDGNLWLMGTDGSNPRQLTTEGGYGEPDFSPDGQALAFVRRVEVEPGKTGQQIGWLDVNTLALHILVEPVPTPFPLTKTYYQYRAPQWSPDGRWLYFLANDGRASGDSIRKVRLSDGHWDYGPEQVRSGRFGPFDLHPDGVRLAYTAWTAIEFIVAVTEDPGAYGQALVQGNSAYGDICWLGPDALAFVATAVGSQQSSIETLSPQGGGRATLLAGAGIQKIGCSPNGESLVYAASGQLQFLDLETGSTTPLGPGTDPAIGPPTLDPAPASGLIAYRGPDLNLWIVALNGSPPVQITTDAGATYADNGNFVSSVSYRRFRWSPDGAMLAMERHVLTQGAPLPSPASLWVYAPDSQSLRLVLEATPGLGGLAWAPDSRRLAYALAVTWGETAPIEPIHGLWQVEVETGLTSELVAPERGLPLLRPSWSPDGRYLAFEEVRYIEGRGAMAVFDFQEGVYLPWERVAGAYSWFPAGGRLVFDENVYAVGDTNQLWTAAADGHNQTPFTARVTGRAPVNPVVAPTGERVAYFVYASGQEGRELWIADANGGNPYRPSPDRSIGFFDWSPGGDFLVVSRAGSPDREIGLVDIDSGAYQPITTGAEPLWQPGPQSGPAPTPTPAAEEACGDWQWEEIFPDNDDPRVEIRTVSTPQDRDCRVEFEFENGTPKFIGGPEFGGYTLELEAAGENTRLLEWQPPAQPTNVLHTYLLPRLEVDLHIDPLDPRASSQVNIQGDYSLHAMSVDAGLFILHASLSLVAPGTSCLIPEEAIAYAAVRNAHLLTSSLQLALRGDFLGARAEIARVLPEFYDGSADAMEAAGVDCARELVALLFGIPGLVLRVSTDYVGWIGVYLFDYGFNHGWRPIDIRFYYTPPA